MTDRDHDHDRDPVVADALRRMRVADHAPGFWADLERRLDLADRGQDGGELPRAERVVVPMVSVPPEAPPQDIRIATGELPAIPIHQHAAPTRRHTGRWLGVAAAVLVVASAVAVTTIARNGDDDLAGAPTTTAAASTFGDTMQAPASTPVSAPPDTAVPTDLEAPEVAVERWVQALGTGDPEGAAGLLGPRTLGYLRANEIDPVGMMVESEEGYGGWATTPPPNVYLLDQQTVVSDDGADPTEVAVVVVEGIWSGEGEREQRYDVLPVVDTPDGWRIEHLGFDPSVGGQVEFTSPGVGADGLEPVAADGQLDAFFTTTGTVEFVVDGVLLHRRATAMVGQPVAQPFANVELQNRLEPGDHSLSIVFMSPSAVYVNGPIPIRVAG